MVVQPSVFKEYQEEEPKSLKNLGLTESHQLETLLSKEKLFQPK